MQLPTQVETNGHPHHLLPVRVAIVVGEYTIRGTVDVFSKLCQTHIQFLNQLDATKLFHALTSWLSPRISLVADIGT